MRKIIVATVTGVSFLSAALSAQAADMAVKVRPIPMAAPAFSWTGFYVGANVGGAWGSNGGSSDGGLLFPPFAVLPPVTQVFTVIPGQLGALGGGGNRSGVIGGGQIGYNWQISQFVLGVEADAVGSGLGGSNASATRSFGPPILPVTVSQTVAVDVGRIDWMASFRGRVGVSVDRALFYATGGAAVAEIGG